MERLTVDTNIIFCDIAQCRSVPGGSYCEDGYCDARRVYERLREYERLAEKWQLDVNQIDTLFSRVNALGGLDLFVEYLDIVPVEELRALKEARRVKHDEA